MGEKKAQGCKRILVLMVGDTFFMFTTIAADLPDTKEASLVMDRLVDKYPSIQALQEMADTLER
jgi:hypothetical protein